MKSENEDVNESKIGVDGGLVRRSRQNLTNTTTQKRSEKWKERDGMDENQVVSKWLGSCMNVCMYVCVCCVCVCVCVCVCLYVWMMCEWCIPLIKSRVAWLRRRHSNTIGLVCKLRTRFHIVLWWREALIFLFDNSSIERAKWIWVHQLLLPLIRRS